MTGGRRSWQGRMCVCEHPARLRSTAACRTEACAAGPRDRLSLPLSPGRGRRRRRGRGEGERGRGRGGGGRPEAPDPVSSQHCKFLLGAHLGWGRVVPAARLGECSLTKGSCAGEEEMEVGR